METRFYIALLSFLLLSGAYAEERVDHRAEENKPVPQSPVSNQNTPTRQEALVEEIKEAGLSSSALRTLDLVFRQNPQIDNRRFEELLTELSKEERKKIISPDQIENLRKIYSQSLNGLGENAGTEFGAAVRTVLQQTPPEKKGKPAPAEGEPPPELKAVQAQLLASAEKKAKELESRSKALTPEALQTVLKNLSTQDPNPQPAVEEASSNSGELDFGILEAIKLLLEKEKNKEEEKGEKEVLSRLADRGFVPPVSPRREKRERAEKQAPEEKPRREKSELSEAPSVKAPEKETKEEEKKKEDPKASEKPSPRRRNEEPEDTEEETKEKDAPEETPSLPELPAPPKKSPLQGPSAGRGESGGGESNRPGQGGVGGGGEGGGKPPGSMGGAEGGSAFGGGGADPFSGVGAGEGGAMPPPPGGYSIAKDGGFGAAAGGGGEGGGFESTGPEEVEESPSNTSSTNPGSYRGLPSAANRSPELSTAGHFLLEQYVGTAIRGLCSTKEAKKTIGICMDRESKQDSKI